MFAGNFVLWAVKSNEISMVCLGYSVPGHVDCCPVCYTTRSNYQVGAGREMFSDLLSEAKSILRVVHIHYCRFPHDVTKLKLRILLILPMYYFNDV